MFNVAVTAIILNSDDQVLLVKRSLSEKKWPGKWTVPGGKVETTDFLGTPTPINNQWYDVLENAVRREVKEEVGMHIKGIRYLCSIAVPDTIIISFIAYPASKMGQIDGKELTEYAWVYSDELDNYDLIDGIKDEILIAQASRR